MFSLDVMRTKRSLVGPILFAALLVAFGILGILQAREAWLHHPVVWVSAGRGAPRSWLDPRASAVAHALFILVGLSYLAARIVQRMRAD